MPQFKQATARAFANIALCKYWGKRGNDNGPDTPSISLALQRLETTTTVRLRSSGRDVIKLNGKRPSRAVRQRLVEYLDRWREAGLLASGVRIESGNRFPTAAGLASSASGYAALATALAAVSSNGLSEDEISRWARRGSGSAARSVTGGMSELDAGSNPAAQLITPARDVPWGMVLAIVDAPAKQVSSREGMRLSQDTSPYYRKWVLTDRFHYRQIYRAIQRWDLTAAGGAVEANALAMHACMLATSPPLLYWAPGTLALLQAVRHWRKSGLEVYATIDAGPHVALLCALADLQRVAARARRVAGVVQALPSMPGGAAAIIDTA